VADVANSHCIKLILNIPIKAADHHFTLYRIIILPERISSDRFFQCTIDYPYLALQVSQRGYVLFTESDYSKCIASTFTVCPINAAIFNTRQLTCEISFFFQTANHQQLCKRNLFLNYQRPTLIRHGTASDFPLPDAAPANATLAGNSSRDLPH
jgi:hypothetical protein